MKPDTGPFVDGRRKRLVAAGAAVIPLVILVYHLGGTLHWPSLVLPIGVTVFTFLWTWLLTRWMGNALALVTGVLVGAALAHLMLWAPFLVGSYSGAHGASGLDFALSAGFFTAAVVAWYTLAAHWVETLLISTAVLAWMIGVLAIARKVDG